jgi:hypothetical protein
VTRERTADDDEVEVDGLARRVQHVVAHGAEEGRV